MTSHNLPDAAELTRLLERDFPQAFGPQGSYQLEAAAPMTSRLRLHYSERHLRPGGTISGPAMFGLADCALYVAVLATIGWLPLSATTSLTLNFLRRPEARDMLAHCKLLRVGRTLAVGEVTLLSDGAEEPVAHATGTYVVTRPPTR